MEAQIEVFYDGLCPICTKEIDHYRKIDKDRRIQFVNIASPDFDAKKEGFFLDQLMEVFHVRDRDGRVHRGVDGFVRIWDVLEIWRPLKRLATNAITRPIFELGYFLFTKVRPYLRRSECEDGTCQIRS